MPTRTWWRPSAARCRSRACRADWPAYAAQVRVAQAGYVANESLEPVDFGQLTLEHAQGLQVQETQYDPYGLELAGLNRAPLLENKYTWNGKERQDEFGLRWLDHGWRFYDPQLGRWVVVDPDAEEADQEGWTTYQFGFGNPVRYNDLDGRKPGCCGEEAMQSLNRELSAVDQTVRQAGKSVAGAVSALVTPVKNAFRKVDELNKSMKEAPGSNGQNKGGYNMQTAQARKVGSNETINGTGNTIDYYLISTIVSALGGLIGPQTLAGSQTGAQRAKDVAGELGNSADGAVGAGLGQTAPDKNEPKPKGDTIGRKAGWVHPSSYYIKGGAGKIDTVHSAQPLIQKKR